MILLKTIVWRIVSFSIALITGYIWFGDWHVSGFTMFITFLMMGVYYIFEINWNRLTKEYYNGKKTSKTKNIY